MQQLLMRVKALMTMFKLTYNYLLISGRPFYISPDGFKSLKPPTTRAPLVGPTSRNGGGTREEGYGAVESSWAGIPGQSDKKA
jgi:hypothetical protein